MFDLPDSSKIRKNIYKKTIYQKFSKELTGNKKENFDKEIKKITVINEISEQSVNIRSTEDISAIFVVLIELKTKDFSPASINLITRLFGQNILLVLSYENQFKIAIYETKLILGKWKNENELSIRIQGLNLSSVWENLVTQVADFKIEKGNSLADQIDIEDKKERLKKLIIKTEKKARRETQAKKKFELFQQIKAYKKELEEY